MAHICGECGVSIAATDSYCPDCGGDQTVDPATEPTPAVTPIDDGAKEATTRGSFIWTLPFVEPGHTGRNIVLASVYLLFFGWMLLLWFPYATARNKNGIGDRLASSPAGKIPGIAKGGITAGLVVFFILFLTMGAVATLAPAADDPDAAANTVTPTPTPAPAATMSETTTPTPAETSTQTASPTKTAAPTQTASPTPTESPTATTTPTPTSTPTAAPAPTPEPLEPTDDLPAGTGDIYVDTIVEVLTDSDVPVSDAVRGSDDIIYLELRPDELGNFPPHAGSVTGAYAGAVDHGESGNGLVVLALADGCYGTYAVEHHWATNYASGYWTEEVTLTNVVSTYQWDC